MAPRIAAACCLLLLAGCGGDGGSGEAKGAAPNWPAPANPMELTRGAGLVPERAEFLQYHVHAHLDVFFNGDPVTVPAGIGIDTTNPAAVSDEQGVGLTSECDKPVVNRAIEGRLGLEVVDVVQCLGRDNGVRSRQRAQEAAFAKGDPIRDAGQSGAGFLEHVHVDVENGDANAGQALQDGGRQRAGATAQVEDVPIGGRKRRKQLDTCRDHVVVVRDEAPDLDVVAFRIDAEMTLDRVRFPTGHSAEPTT